MTLRFQKIHAAILLVCLCLVVGMGATTFVAAPLWQTVPTINRDNITQNVAVQASEIQDLSARVTKIEQLKLAENVAALQQETSLILKILIALLISVVGLLLEHLLRALSLVRSMGRMRP